MSFGGVALPTPSSTGAGDDRPPSSNAPSTPVPPAPPHFSSNFTFQGSSAPPRPYASTTFSFPGPQMPSSAPPSFVPSSAPPPRLPYASPGMFPYQSTPTNLPQAASGGLPPYGVPGQTHLRPANQSPISAQAPLPSTAPGQAPPQPLGTGPVAQGLTSATMSPQLRPLPMQPTAVQAQGQATQAPAIGGSISATGVVPPAVPQVPTSAGQMSTSVGSVATRPGPLPTPQYRAPFVANPALSLSSGGMAPRFPGGPFVPIVRQPTFPPRAPGPLIRAPLGPLMRPGALVRPLLLEKPQTLVYVGKIAPTVDDECLRSILELCGPIKSWKRAQEPTVGSFGFCEFESPEGVLRALRLLNGFSLDGRELKLTVTQAAREYLERYVQKKKEREQQLKQDGNNAAEETAPGVEASESVKNPDTEPSKEDQANEVHGLDEKSFGLVNEEDKEADETAQKKLAILSEERAKQMPVPPVSLDADGKSASTSDTPAKLHYGDSVADEGKTDGENGSNEEEFSEIKGSSGLDKSEISSSDRVKKFDTQDDREKDRSRERESKGRDRDKDRERERKKEKDWEIDQLERERERSRSRRERDKEIRLRDAERMYEDAEKAWEEREKEKERIRNVDKEKEREREKQRWRLIKEQEEESDDEGWKKSRRRDVYGERKRMQREREDDEKDRVREEEEIVEAKRRKLKEDYEEQVKKRLAEMAQNEAVDAAVNAIDVVEGLSAEPQTVDIAESIQSEGGTKNVSVGQEAGTLMADMDVDEKQNTTPAPKKLGFGLIGTGKRAALPSVFTQEDEEDVHKDRVLRPLVPIEYTAEEILAVSSLKPSSSASLTPNLAAAAEFAKSLSNLRTSSSKELDLDHDKERKQNEKSKENQERKKENVKLDAKQLIDTIPKTKDELFAYEIDWNTYDQHALHERMKPWIQKKIEEFLGEEEDTLVDFIVTNTKKHANAESMLEMLTQILDDEAELFVMKMWRMLIFEIKKVETGLTKMKY